MSTTQAPPASVRRRLRIFLADAVEGEDQVTTEDLVTKALVRFMNDEDFAAAAAYELITKLIPVLLQEHMHQRRDIYVTTASGAISRKRLEETASERLSKVFENVGGEYKTFMTMTKPDLISTAESRERRAAGELRWARFERETAALMPNDKVMVEECLTSKELGALLSKHFPEPAE